MLECNKIECAKILSAEIQQNKLLLLINWAKEFAKFLQHDFLNECVAMKDVSAFQATICPCHAQRNKTKAQSF